MSDVESRVEIIYAATFRDFSFSAALPHSEYRISDLFDDSKVCNWLAENAIKVSSVGVWGKKVSSDYVLKSGDRVEIYRPLIADPKDLRRRGLLGRKNSDS